jgi:hypothetical protein
MVVDVAHMRNVRTKRLDHRSHSCLSCDGVNGLGSEPHFCDYAASRCEIRGRIKCSSYGVAGPLGSAMENNATSCPQARIPSIESNRYDSVPLNRKLYLLQYRILMRIGFSDAFRRLRNINKFQKSLRKIGEIHRSIEPFRNGLSGSASHGMHDWRATDERLQLVQEIVH